jgi:SAM-dependent methyltransferase
VLGRLFPRASADRQDLNPPNSTHTPSWALRTDGRLEEWPTAPAGEGALFERLRDVCEEGLAIAARIDGSRPAGWHSFVPADYDTVLQALLGIRERGGRFLELGSATGVVAIMADLLGFEACGIEIAPELVREARGLAERHSSAARFATGSYIPAGYRYVSADGDTRMGTVAIGEPAYEELQYELSDFDWVYAFPWPGETEVIRDVMRRSGAPRSHLLLHGYSGGLELYPTS